MYMFIHVSKEEFVGNGGCSVRQRQILTVDTQLLPPTKLCAVPHHNTNHKPDNNKPSLPPSKNPHTHTPAALSALKKSMNVCLNCSLSTFLNANVCRCLHKQPSRETNTERQPGLVGDMLMSQGVDTLTLNTQSGNPSSAVCASCCRLLCFKRPTHCGWQHIHACVCVPAGSGA